MVFRPRAEAMYERIALAVPALKIWKGRWVARPGLRFLLT